MTNAIRIQNAVKRFGRKTVLDGVSLNVPEGVVFALLGENGAGKSTLIRGLLGYHKFTSGFSDILGLDPAEQPMDVRRMVGYVSDAPALYDWMTVAQIGWYASGFYRDGFLKKYDELIQEFELPAGAKIKSLSKGMRAKVALSLAMAFDPAVLILDEPTSGLDPLVRRTFLESMIDRAAAGQTVFLSSHQINEVERVADWVAILHQGVLQVAAPLEDLKNDVTMLSFSKQDPLLTDPVELEDCKVLQRSQEGRSVRMMVIGTVAGTVEKLQAHPGILDVKSMRPNLEELYLGFTQPADVDVEEKPLIKLPGQSVA